VRNDDGVFNELLCVPPKFVIVVVHVEEEEAGYDDYIC